MLDAIAPLQRYGVEIAMLIDALRAVGLDRMAQVQLGTRQNRHQPLQDLSAMRSPCSPPPSAAYWAPSSSTSARRWPTSPWGQVLQCSAEGGMLLCKT